MTSESKTDRPRRQQWRIIALLAAGFALLIGVAAHADQIPNFWDPQHRMEKPDLSTIRLIRFVTQDDYPPFDFTAPDGSLTGFNVDLSRALCDELKVSCTIQSRRWDTILGAIASGKADAAAASLAITPDNRTRVDFTQPYYRTPARFITRKGNAWPDPIPRTLAGRTIGVQAHTAHEAYLRAFFPRSKIRTYETAAALRSALKRKEVHIIFGDGISLALWLNGSDSENCCAFKGGPYTESRYFGEGVGIAVRKGNVDLRRALDYGLKRLSEKGVYAELYLKYFPLGFY